MAANRYKDKIKPKRDRRLYWLDKYKVSKGCEECGYSKHPAALHFDHIDRSQKISHVKNLGGCSIRKLVAEVRKCRILCANCHSVHSFEERHLTTASPSVIKWRRRK